MLVIHHKLQSLDSQNIQRPKVRFQPVFLGEVLLALCQELTNPANVTHGETFAAEVVAFG